MPGATPTVRAFALAVTGTEVCTPAASVRISNPLALATDASNPVVCIETVVVIGGVSGGCPVLAVAVCGVIAIAAIARATPTNVIVVFRKVNLLSSSKIQVVR
jgi:hypothetical protein